MKTYGEVGVQLHHSWPRHWMEMSGQLYAPAASPPRKGSSVLQPVLTLWQKESFLPAENRIQSSVLSVGQFAYDTRQHRHSSLFYFVLQRQKDFWHILVKVKHNLGSPPLSQQ
jgi:hypothetical protein